MNKISNKRLRELRDQRIAEIKEKNSDNSSVSKMLKANSTIAVKEAENFISKVLSELGLLEEQN